MSEATYLDPSDANVAALLARNLEGPVVMLNLLRFREGADYSNHPELAPSAPISGRAAFDRYVDHTLPFLRASGDELLYFGVGGPYLVGPTGEGWDAAMLVRQSSVASFLAFATDDGYLRGIGHRAAALIDSRILPLSDHAVPAPRA